MTGCSDTTDDDELDLFFTEDEQQSPQFAHVWVSGSNMYLDTFRGGSGSHVINYADLSVIGL